PFAATATEIQKAELRVIRSGSLADALQASMAMPAIFQYFEAQNGERLIDGGVAERIPVSTARALGADFVIAVDALGPPRKDLKIRGVLDMIEQTYLVMDWAANKSRILSEPDLLITPDQGSRSLYKFSDNASSVEAGVAAAEKALPEIRQRISQWRLGIRRERRAKPR
ncbi:MAG: patatin-like phospholipase family protein, partial [Firmicutes bacterium]|nr:patatin-like phospholipase family protein [Bacillota bacterium]